MSSIKVDDVFDGLIRENKELIEDMLLANDLIDCLQRLRNCLIDFNSKCNCHQNNDNKSYFKLLDNKYQKLIRENNINRLSAHCTRLSYLDRLLKTCDKNRVKIKDEPIDEKPIIKSEPSSCPNPKRNARTALESSLRPHKRKSVTFDETNNTVNEFEIIPEADAFGGYEFSDNLSEQFLVKDSYKMSTNLTRDEIINWVMNDECVARIDANQRCVKILYSSTSTLGQNFSDEYIIGFGCRLCEYVTNRKKQIITHFEINHLRQRAENIKYSLNDNSRNTENSVISGLNSNINNNQTSDETMTENDIRVNDSESVANATEDNVILINATKVSTKFTSTQIRDIVENQPTISLPDLDNKDLQILFRNNGRLASDDTMIGFACNLCDFLSNRKLYVKQHILRHHRKKDVLSRPHLPAQSKHKTNNEVNHDLHRESRTARLSTNFAIDSILGSTHSRQQTTNGNGISHSGPEGKSITPIIDLEQIIKDEIGDIAEEPEIIPSVSNLDDDSDGVYFEDEPIDVDSGSDQEFKADVIDISDDSSDADWTDHGLKKRKKKKKKSKNEETVRIVSEYQKIKIPVPEIQNKLANNECLFEDDKFDQLIRLVLTKNSNSDEKPILIGYICKWIGCDKVFAVRKNIKKHINSVHETQPKEHKCDYQDCNFSAATAMHLSFHRRKHIREQHLSLLGIDANMFKKNGKKVNKDFLMELCRRGEVTEEIDQTNQHLIILRSKAVNEEDFARVVGYKCNFSPDCNLISVSKYKIVDHLNSVHLKLKCYECVWPSCDYYAPSRSRLKNHMAMHEDIRPFPCTWPGCDFRCRKKSHLDAHLITHGTERPFKCDWPSCDKGFRSESCMRAHLVTHTRDKKVKCPWPGCLSTFRDSAGLRNHMMIHKGEWPFACPDEKCHKRFRQKQAMVIHFRKRHPDQLDLLSRA